MRAIRVLDVNDYTLPVFKAASKPEYQSEPMRSIAAFLSNQPRPTNGIFVAMTVMNWMFASSGRLAMWTTALATC